ncbi:DUF4113 domain-containing protein [Hymenobacter wooponensis]
MADLDRLNERYVSGTVRFATVQATVGRQPASYTGQRQWQSPAYTTNWDDLLQKRA